MRVEEKIVKANDEMSRKRKILCSSSRKRKALLSSSPTFDVDFHAQSFSGDHIPDLFSFQYPFLATWTVFDSCLRLFLLPSKAQNLSSSQFLNEISAACSSKVIPKCLGIHIFGRNVYVAEENSSLILVYKIDKDNILQISHSLYNPKLSQAVYFMMTANQEGIVLAVELDLEPTLFLYCYSHCGQLVSCSPCWMIFDLTQILLQNNFICICMGETVSVYAFDGGWIANFDISFDSLLVPLSKEDQRNQLAVVDIGKNLGQIYSLQDSKLQTENFSFQVPGECRALFRKSTIVFAHPTNQNYSLYGFVSSKLNVRERRLECHFLRPCNQESKKIKVS